MVDTLRKRDDIQVVRFWVNDAASKSALDAAQEKLGVELSDDVLALYRQANGLSGRAAASDVLAGPRRVYGHSRLGRIACVAVHPAVAAAHARAVVIAAERTRQAHPRSVASVGRASAVLVLAAVAGGAAAEAARGAGANELEHSVDARRARGATAAALATAPISDAGVAIRPGGYRVGAVVPCGRRRWARWRRARRANG